MMMFTAGPTSTLLKKLSSSILNRGLYSKYEQVYTVRFRNHRNLTKLTESCLKLQPKESVEHRY